MADQSLLTQTDVELTLDGRVLKLRYRAYAFIRYAEETGGDLLAELKDTGTLAEAAARGEGRQSTQLFIKTRDFLWAGLIDENPKLTRDEVAHMFGVGDLVPIMSAVSDALRRTMPTETATPNPLDGKAPGLVSPVGLASLPS
jgi:hypothetical protein